MIALGSKLIFLVCIISTINSVRGTSGYEFQHRRLLQQVNDYTVTGGGSEDGGDCLGAVQFSRALLEVCIVVDLAEFVSLPSTYRTACCNLVEQYFSRECAGTCVAEEAMQQTNIWLSVCRVNLPPLQTCTEEELQLQAPLMEQIPLPTIQAVQQILQDVQQEESPSAAPQLQKDPVVVSSTQQTQDSLNSLALNTELFQTDDDDDSTIASPPPPPAALIQLFSSGDAQMRAAERPGTQMESTYVLPQVVVGQSPDVIMPLSIPILPSIDVTGFQQLKLLEAIQSIDAIKLFASAVIVNQPLVEELQKPGFFTVFAPTDTAVVEFISTRSSDEGINLWRDAVVHHFVADKINISDMSNGEKPLVMFDNKETVVERISTSVAIGGDLVLLKGCCSEGNFARVVVADVPVKNGMLHIVDRVLVPSQAFP
eukprot:TRINITY_DN1699_c0_g1_i14.p1 TRINITY_DN1699_c0_g1~~TRINITY_DN1699_c0_g1_i14.p1  ORF type:complete len:427 (-),score=78.99 TRINITY_DN1699_c0_g1_i14:600-1880(-)